MKSKLEFLKDIESQEILTQIVLEEREANIREIALKKITSEELLFLIAKKSENWKTRAAVTKKIQDQKKLCSIAMFDDDVDVAMLALSKVTKEELLREIALYSVLWQVRKEAVCKITNEEMLLSISYNTFCSDKQISLFAISRINDVNNLEKVMELYGIDEDVIKTIAPKMKNCNVSKYSLKFITLDKVKEISDKEILEQILECSIFPDVVLYLIERVDNVELLEKMLFRFKDIDIRIAAMDKIYTLKPKGMYATLLKVATLDKSPIVRSKAIRYIKNQKEALGEIALTDKSSDVRYETIELLGDESEESLLQIVLNNEECEQNRLLALSKIKNKKLLIDKASGVTNWYIKMVIWDETY